MLITVTGCKTGQKYSTPVGFYREDGYLWVVSSRDRTWWRNVKKGANDRITRSSIGFYDPSAVGNVARLRSL